MPKNESLNSSVVLAKLYSLFSSRDAVLASYQKSLDDDKGKWGHTLDLVQHLKALQVTRSPFFLTFTDFNKILRWKLRQQYGRQIANREANTDYNIQEVTRAAFTVRHEDFECETELKLRLLTALRGVEIPVASAILTLCFPNKYAVIDSRNWKRLIDNNADKTSYTPKQYLFYLNIIKQAADYYSVTTQQLDIAIWALG